MTESKTSPSPDASLPSGIASLPAPAAAKPSMAVTQTPGLTGTTTLYLGDFAAQLLKAIAPAASQVMGVVVEDVVEKMPMGALISEFIGPTVISSYVSQALTTLEGLAAAGNIPVNPASYIESTAAALFNTNEAHLAEFLGDTVGPTISALVAKIKF